MGKRKLHYNLKELDIKDFNLKTVAVPVVLCNETNCKIIPITMKEYLYIEEGRTAQGGAMSYSIKDNDTGEIHWCIDIFLLSIGVEEISKLDKIQNYSIIKDI